MQKKTNTLYPMKTYYNVVVQDRNNLNLCSIIDIHSEILLLCESIFKNKRIKQIKIIIMIIIKLVMVLVPYDDSEQPKF